MTDLNFFCVEKGQLGSASFGKDFWVAGEDDPGQKANKGHVSDDQEDLKWAIIFHDDSSKKARPFYN